MADAPILPDDWRSRDQAASDMGTLAGWTVCTPDGFVVQQADGPIASQMASDSGEIGGGD